MGRYLKALTGGALAIAVSCRATLAVSAGARPIAPLEIVSSPPMRNEPAWLPVIDAYVPDASVAASDASVPDIAQELENALCEPAAAIVCEALARCECGSDFLCTVEWSTRCAQWARDQYSGASASVDYDMVATCLDGLEENSARCGQSVLPSACRRMVVDPAQPGEACRTDSYDCRGGRCDESGWCVELDESESDPLRRVAPGDRVEPNRISLAHCEANLDCGENRICSGPPRYLCARVPDGEADEAPCTSGACRTAPELGEPCRWECAAGLRCVADGVEDGSCVFEICESVYTLFPGSDNGA